ncbi:MAG: VWA domain-containing protein [Anaerolineaceae bacterium]|nr:VWA domain-containing protein [Anaerolineaceae bacterium]
MRQEKRDPLWLNRREALKSLAVLSGAATLASLPGEWVTPVIEIGVLPAHAQISSLPSLACIEIGSKIDVMLALDKSGSISILEGIGVQELDQAKVALISFVEGLDFSVDQVGLVSFDSLPTLDQELTQDENLIKAAINAVSRGGLTDIAGAIRLCKNELKSSRANSNNTPVIILLSDGTQTVNGDPISEANQAKNEGITIITVAIRLSADINTLRAIATKNSNFYFVPSPADLITIFDPNCKL